MVDFEWCHRCDNDEKKIQKKENIPVVALQNDKRQFIHCAAMERLQFRRCSLKRWADGHYKDYVTLLLQDATHLYRNKRGDFLNCIKCLSSMLFIGNSEEYIHLIGVIALKEDRKLDITMENQSQNIHLMITSPCKSLAFFLKLWR